MGDSDELPFSRFDKAGRPTPSLFAASVTDMALGMTCSLMKVPGCVDFSDFFDIRFTSEPFDNAEIYCVARHNTIPFICYL